MLITTKFDLGAEVWVAGVTYRQEEVTCPDCLGAGTWEAALPNGEHLQIPCPTCALGYDGSTGKVKSDYCHTPNVYQATVQIVRVDVDAEIDAGGKVAADYLFYDGSYASERNVFSTREEAQARADEMAAEAAGRDERAYLERLTRKRGNRPGSEVSALRARIAHHRMEITRLEAHLAKLQAGTGVK